MAPRQANRLNTKQADALKEPGRYNDGDGLILQISPAGGKSWLFKFRHQGKIREMGLGSYRDVGLKDARDLARGARGHLKEGRDPILEKRVAAAMEQSGAIDAEIPTFKVFALAMVDRWEAAWKSDKHIAQWKMSIEHYAKSLSDLPLDRIETEHILKVLLPIWSEKPETGRRVRARIERILDAATVLKHRAGDNPARFSGHLEMLLSATKRLSRGHHAAVPYQQMPDLMTRLHELKSTSSQALEFLILTVSRTNEVIYARPAEIDRPARLWTVPAERMKSGRIHRVPLCDRAMEIIDDVWPTVVGRDGYLFRGGSQGGRLSNMAMSMCLRGMLAGNSTVHGFRSTFRDWAGDETDFAREIAEAALAHIVGDKAEQAYRRGDALERRRALMQAWADYCLTQHGETAL